MKDAQMEADIHHKLLAHEKKSWIQVIARDGYINLFGFVGGFKEKREITEIVQSLPGVQIVTDHLHVDCREDKKEVAHF